MKFCDDYLAIVEEQIEQEIARHSVIFWLHVLRRIFPSPAGENVEPVTNGWVRATLESSAQKFGQLSDCGDVAGSRDVPIERVLNGLLLRTEFTAEREHLKNGPTELVLTTFDVVELRHVYDCQKLCYEVWKCMASRRALSKGAQLQVFPSQPFFHDKRTAELDALIESYDRRQPFTAVTATATVYKPNDEHAIGLPHYNVGMQKFDKQGLIAKRLGVQMHEEFIPNFVWLSDDLAAFYKAHEHFALAFLQKHKVALADAVAVIAALSLHVITQWRKFEEIIRYWQRAYDGPSRRELIVEEIGRRLPIAIERCSLPAEAATVNVNAVFDFLELGDAQRASIDIGLAGPRAIFIPAAGSNRYYIDYEPLASRLYYLFFGLKVEDQNFKGDALEALIRNRESVLPHAAMRASDGSARQVDASFAADDTLVIVECRAVGRSLGMERGDPAAVKYRNDLINRTLRDVDDKAQWLRGHSRERQDIMRFRRILPIGVTPFREFIPSRDRYYWVTDTLPRVMTPDELTSALDDGTFEGDCENSVATEATGPPTS